MRQQRLTIVSGLNVPNFLISGEALFANLGWLEREAGEMYGHYYNFKTDQRKLLLDYSTTENPMCRDYAVEGRVTAFFSVFDDQVVSTQSDTVEL